MNTIQETALYTKLSIKAMLKKPAMSTLRSVFKYGSSWHKFHANGISTLSERIPWISFGAIDKIKEIIRPEMTVFEYGSGGSTLFWADRVKKVISVEHNREWHEKMKEEFSGSKVHHVDYFLVEAEKDDRYDEKSADEPLDYISSDEEFRGKKFEKYASKIEEYPDESFDMVVVDGRARPSCIFHSLKKVKPDGYLVIDNSEREYYLTKLQKLLAVWEKKDFYGPVPFNYQFSQTTIFQKRKA